MMKLNCKRIGAYDFVCYPACENSFRACRLVGADYLTDDQIKILELMGHEVVCVFEDEEITNTYLGEYHGEHY